MDEQTDRSEPPPKSDPNCPLCGGTGWRYFTGELFRDGTIVSGTYRCNCGWAYMDWYSKQSRARARAIRDKNFWIGQTVVYKGLVRAKVSGYSSKRVLIVYASPTSAKPVSSWVSPNSLQPIEDDDE